MSALANRRSVMMLYSEPTSATSHCVRIVLAEKDINVEIKYIDSGDIPEEISELNPYNSVLTLIDRDLVLYDAQIMMEYLDERFPHPPLMPVDPVHRALNRQLRYRIVNDLYSLLHELESGDNKRVSASTKALRDNLTAISPALGQQEFFMSDEFSLVDCCLAPLLWRLDVHGIKLPAQAKPLQKYADALFARDAFKACLSPQEKEMRT